MHIVCIQLIPHWGTNQEYSINQGNTVFSIPCFQTPQFTNTYIVIASAFIFKPGTSHPVADLLLILGIQYVYVCLLDNINNFSHEMRLH